MNANEVDEIAKDDSIHDGEYYSQIRPTLFAFHRGLTEGIIDENLSPSSFKVERSRGVYCQDRWKC